jgi:hypothetical protein
MLLFLAWIPCCLYPILNILLLLSFPKCLTVSFLSWIPSCLYPILNTFLFLPCPKYLAANIPISNTFLLLTYPEDVAASILPWIDCRFYPILKTLLLLTYPEYLTASIISLLLLSLLDASINSYCHADTPLVYYHIVKRMQPANCIHSWTVRQKTRGLAGPTRRLTWLAGGEWPSRVWFCTWWTVHAACPDGPHHLPRPGADLLLNVHKTPSWAVSRKEGKAWYSGRPMPSLWLLLWLYSHSNHTKIV